MPQTLSMGLHVEIISATRPDASSWAEFNQASSFETIDGIGSNEHL